MPNQDAFLQAVQQGYKFKGENVKIGCAMHDGQVHAAPLGYGTLPTAIVSAYESGLKQLQRDDWAPPAL